MVESQSWGTRHGCIGGLAGGAGPRWYKAVKLVISIFSQRRNRTYISSFRSLFAIFLFSRKRVVPVIGHGGDVHLWHALAERGYSICIGAFPRRGRSFADERIGADR
jgi:hypothetical protein